MPGKTMPLVRLTGIVVASACLAAFWTSSGRGRDAADDSPARAVGDHSTLADLRDQINQCFRDQWPDVPFEAIEIVQFQEPSTRGSLVIGLRFQWDARNDTTTGVTLYQVAGRYYVGTLRMEGKPRPVNVLVAFQ